MPLINPSSDHFSFYIKTTYRALVDAIIPFTPEATEGADLFIGAASIGIEDYVIWSLDHFLSIPMELSLSDDPLSVQTAIMLDEAASRLISSGKAYSRAPAITNTGLGAFAALTPEDRFRVISLLEQLDIDLDALPAPYTNNAPMVVLMADILNRLPLFGYYTEWAGYGTTRMRTPEGRVLEWWPASWMQIEYPGPAYGYRDFRGYVLSPQLRDYS